MNRICLLYTSVRDRLASGLVSIAGVKRIRWESPTEDEMCIRDRFLRGDQTGNVRIPAGRIVRTQPDGKGDIYRYVTDELAVLPEGCLLYTSRCV